MRFVSQPLVGQPFPLLATGWGCRFHLGGRGEAATVSGASPLLVQRVCPWGGADGTFQMPARLRPGVCGLKGAAGGAPCLGVRRTGIRLAPI